MLARIDRKAIRRRIRHRIRREVSGTAARPRMAVYRSQKHIYVQAVDDEGGRTIAHASTQEADVRAKVPKAWNIQAAEAVGVAMADKLKAAGVETVVFDRGGNVYHGRVKAVAEAMRSAGLKF